MMIFINTICILIEIVKKLLFLQSKACKVKFTGFFYDILLYIPLNINVFIKIYKFFI